MLRAFRFSATDDRLPVVTVTPVAVPIIVRPAAVIGIRSGSVIVVGRVAVVSVARTVIPIRARGERAGSEAERQAGPDTAGFRRRGHGGRTNRGNRRQNGQ